MLQNVWRKKVLSRLQNYFSILLDYLFLWTELRPVPSSWAYSDLDNDNDVDEDDDDDDEDNKNNGNDNDDDANNDDDNDYHANNDDDNDDDTNNDDNNDDDDDKELNNRKPAKKNNLITAPLQKLRYPISIQKPNLWQSNTGPNKPIGLSYKLFSSLKSFSEFRTCLIYFVRPLTDSEGKFSRKFDWVL